MTLSSRRALHFATIFLVVRILVDLATPLLPGAFRLNPDQSIEAVTASHQIVGSGLNVRAPTIAHRTQLKSPASPGAMVRQPEPHGVRQIRTPVPHITYFTEPTASSLSSDDD